MSVVQHVAMTALNRQIEEEEEALNLKKQWLALQRLLYCMERPPPASASPSPSHPSSSKEEEEEEEEEDENDIATTSWYSLLLRAQHCQDLWQDIQQREGSNMNPHTHIQVSHRIDQACRRAHEMAEIAREKQQQQQQQEQQQHRHGSSSSTRSADLIDRIFFMEFGNKESGDKDDDEDDDGPYDGLLLDEEPVTSEDTADEAEPSTYSTTTTTTPNTDTNTNTKYNTSMSMEDLQQAQREQMEEAIGLMAAQMKDATQGIQHQLQQQTKKTLTELETVAEQNVHDVTAIAQNVLDHNQSQRRRNWGTWTLLFTVVGVFCFCLVTIFTIPKRPNTCLVFCRSSKGETSFVGWLAHPLKVVSNSIIKPAHSLWQEYIIMGGKEEEKVDDSIIDTTSWDELYDEDEVKRQEKEKLARLLSNLQKETKKKTSENDEGATQKVDWREAMDGEGDDEETNDEDEDDIEDDPFGDRQPVRQEDSTDPTENDDDDDDDGDPFGGRKPVLPGSHGSGNDKAGDSAAGSAEILPNGAIKDVDMADLLASLSQAAKKAQEEEDLVTKEAAASHGAGENLNLADMGTPPEIVDEAAKRRVSPRDIRTAADAGDVDKLQNFLELQPTFVDRQDRNKWSALHLAARSGQTEAIRLLVEHGASLTLHNSRGNTPLDEARIHLGADHPSAQLLRELGGEIDGGSSGDPVGIRPKLAKSDTVRLALLEARDDAEDVDVYVQAGREKLDQIQLDLSGARIKPPASQETISMMREEMEEELEKYVQTGRSRLEEVLGKESLRSEL